MSHRKQGQSGKFNRERKSEYWNDHCSTEAKAYEDEYRRGIRTTATAYMGDKSRSRDPLGHSALKKQKTTACCKYDKFTTYLNGLVESSGAQRIAQQTDFPDFERYNPKAGSAGSKQDPRVSREDLASSDAAHNMEGEQNIAVGEAQNKTTKRKSPIIWAPNAKSLPIRLSAHKLEQAPKRQKRSKHETETLEQPELPRKAEKQRKSEDERKPERLRVQRDIAEKPAQSLTRYERERAQRKICCQKQAEGSSGRPQAATKSCRFFCCFQFARGS